MQLHQVTWPHSGCRMLENHSPFISFKSALIKQAISVLTNITFFYFFTALILVFYTWLQGEKNQVVIIVLKTCFEVTRCLPKAAREMSDTQYDLGGRLIFNMAAQAALFPPHQAASSFSLPKTLKQGLLLVLAQPWAVSRWSKPFVASSLGSTHHIQAATGSWAQQGLVLTAVTGDILGGEDGQRVLGCCVSPQPVLCGGRSCGQAARSGESDVAGGETREKPTGIGFPPGWQLLPRLKFPALSV